MSTAASPCRSKCWSMLCSTITKKLIVSITGLAISGFTLMHMSTNLLLLVNHETYNRASHSLVTNPLIYVAEAGLLFAFLVHLGMALSLAWSNHKARGPKPIRATNGEKCTNLGSRWMVQTGLVLLAFLVLHLITFKYGAHYEITYGTDTMRDLARLVVEKFQDPIYVAWYEFSLVVLFIHLRHGISSSVQSLGIAGSRNRAAQKIGWLFAILVAGGFIIQPLYLMCRGGTL